VVGRRADQSFTETCTPTADRFPDDLTVEAGARPVPGEEGTLMRSKWGQLKVARFALSAGTVAALAAVVGAGFKWG